MLNGIHFLLTYTCTQSCKHCFLHCSPDSQGTMKMEQIDAVLREAKKLGSVQDIYFEGGEPFLVYSLLKEGVRSARRMGFSVGIVTNGFWAKDEEEATQWLEPLAQLGISDLSISDDELHYGNLSHRPSKIALDAALKLGMPARALRCFRPEVNSDAVSAENGGLPYSGGVSLRGRAVKSFASGLPKRDQAFFLECPHEDLEVPKRVHIDAFGNVQVCQGLSMGNCWETPLSNMFQDYEPWKHPVCGPLLQGGPNALAEVFGFSVREGWVDECHLCYSVRAAFRQKLPEVLAPPQAYGTETAV